MSSGKNVVSIWESEFDKHIKETYERA